MILLKFWIFKQQFVLIMVLLAFSKLQNGGLIQDDDTILYFGCHLADLKKKLIFDLQ
jgi:hypothetical protein